jgi:hypothetical protein
MNDEKLVYEIVDDEHPENNVIVDPYAAPPEETPEQKEARREEAFQRAAHAARILLAEKINKRREKENLRSLKSRVAKRRKKEKLAKASRKRNR